MESYAQDPSRHLSFGFTSKWGTSDNSTPHGLDEDTFERWLWRKKEANDLQYADMRSESLFPSFDNLPSDNDMDMRYFDTIDGFFYNPIKHWCFFGEIVSIEKFFRLRFIVKDKAGNKIPIAFYTDLAGDELDPAGIREGYTVAILYAEQHGFLDLTVGIRHESPRNIKVWFMLTTSHG